MPPGDARRKEYLGKTLVRTLMCYTMPMRITPDRAILTVARHNGSWVVEMEGEHFGHSIDKEIAKAAANKRAREIQDGGRPCQVRVNGDHGFFSLS